MDARCAADESAPLRTAKSCGPDASMVGVKLAMMRWRWRPLRVRHAGITPMMVTTKPDHQGEREISRKTIACGNAGCPGELVVTNACATYTSRTRLRVQRAPGIPRSPLGERRSPLGVAPRPLLGGGFSNNSGASRGEKEKLYLRHCEERSDEAIHTFFLASLRIASRSLSSGGALRRPVGSQ
jgi:hypothetical protein